MCDFINGQIIVAAPAGGRVHHEFIDGVIVNLGLPRLSDLYSAMVNARVATGLPLEFLRANLYACEPGMENRVISRLYRLWAEWVADHGLANDDPYRDRTLWIGPNHVLTGAMGELQPAMGSPLGDLADHRSPTGNPPRIAVLDSGISYPPGVRLPDVRGQYSFLGQDRTVTDRLGHGTMTASCIAAIDDAITIDVLKVLSDANIATEFDVLAALSSRPVMDADVVNLSLAFGLQDAACGPCGDRHHSSMSEVFFAFVTAVAERGTLVVAAAGNNNGEQPDVQPLCYPARFSGVVAVGALDDNGEVLATSNLGVDPTDDHDQPYLVFAPGRAVVLERMQDGTANAITGTSVSCAYVSGMLAVIKNVGGYNDKDTISKLIGATTPLTNHDYTRHGHGRVNWPI